MCFFVVVGKTASATGRPLQAYTNNWSDELTCFLDLSPAHDISTGPLAKLPYFSLLPTWATDHPTYRTLEFRVHDINAATSEDDAWAQEGGYNAMGLAINFGCATYLLDAETKALDPWVDDGTGFGGEMWRLLLLTCANARQTLDLIELLAKQIGLASDFCGSFAISDSEEAWVVEAVSGHYWIASRVPDDRYWVQPNMLIMRHFDLNDRDNFRGSEGLAEFARKAGLLPKLETNSASSNPLESFDYAKVFNGSDWLRNNYSRHRLWGTVNLLSPSLHYPIEDELNDRTRPSSFVPDKKITSEMLRQVLACHYEGTEIEAGKRAGLTENDASKSRYSPHCNEGDNTSKATIECDYATAKATEAKITPICRNTSTYAAIFPLSAIESSENQDADSFFLRSYMLVAPYAPCIAFYTPVFLHQSSIPPAWNFSTFEDENVTIGVEKVSQSAHRRVTLTTMQALDADSGSGYYQRIGEVRAHQQEYDSQVERLLNEFKKENASDSGNSGSPCVSLIVKMESLSHDASRLHEEKAALVLNQIRSCETI